MNLGEYRVGGRDLERFFDFHFPPKMGHFCDFFVLDFLTLQGDSYTPDMHTLAESTHFRPYDPEISPRDLFEIKSYSCSKSEPMLFLGVSCSKPPVLGGKMEIPETSQSRDLKVLDSMQRLPKVLESVF